MPTLTSSLRGWASRIPQLTAEEWAENDRRAAEWERSRAQAAFDERLRRSCIPKGFLDAGIASCGEPVRAAAAAVADGSERTVVLQGPYGRGKTYAACAILIEAMRTRRGLFTTVDRYLRAIRSSYDAAETEGEAADGFSHVPVLVIDDFGKARPGAWMLPLLFDLIDFRWSNGLPTVYTTQYSVQELARRLSFDEDRETAKAILSRLSQGAVIAMDGQDRRSWRA